MHPTTQYHLEKFLKNRKKNVEKTPREPSGFMRKQAEDKETADAKPQTERRRRKQASRAAAR